MKNNQGGKLAEFLALLFFLAKGYLPLARNYVTGRGTNAGEVDLIVKKGRLIVFVEVKKRSNLERAAYAVTEKQKQRIIKGAEAFLKKHPQYDDCDVRFDAFLVEFPLHIRHLPNAWIAPRLF